MKTPTISIIGRPNVGKSTLVNRLADKRVCIVGDEAGITRDRNYIDFEWEGKPFTIIDTGGLTFVDTDDFSQEIYEQAMLGLQEADAVIFVVDVTSGIHKLDAEIAELLRREAKVPVYLAVNKVDSPERINLIYEFYQLGFDNLFPISAMHGSTGLTDLLSDLSSNFYKEDYDQGERIKDEIIRISFVGKPNVGKSTLFNKLVGEDRSIVSDISGTTRDSINTKLTRHGNEFELVDTAGLRRKAKVRAEVERFSNLRTTHSIAASDVVVLILDATEEEIVTDQDQKIANLIAERGKACIVLVNKWDLMRERVEQIQDTEELSEEELKQIIEKDYAKVLQKYKEQLEHKLHFISYAPREFISALTGKRSDKVWEMAIAANEQHKRRLSTNVLNQIISDICMLTPPPVVKNKAIKIKYVTQVGVAPPTFVFFANYPELVPESYTRFLEKQIRQYFGFEGTPIVIKFAERT